jgi:hypothetical protein
MVLRHAFPRSEFEDFPYVPGNYVQEELTGLLDKVDALGAAWAGPLQAAAMAVGQLASTFVTFRSCCAPGQIHCKKGTREIPFYIVGGADRNYFSYLPVVLVPVLIISDRILDISKKYFERQCTASEKEDKGR